MRGRHRTQIPHRLSLPLPPPPPPLLLSNPSPFQCSVCHTHAVECVCVEARQRFFKRETTVSVMAPLVRGAPVSPPGEPGLKLELAPAPTKQYSNHPRCLGRNFANKPLLARLNWLHCPLLFLTPLIALYGLATWTFNWRTFLFSIAYYFFTGLGITAGYHRLFAHRAYVARLPLRIFLLLAGSGAVEGSVRWWSRDHRAHHKYVDTERVRRAGPRRPRTFAWHRVADS